MTTESGIIAAQENPRDLRSPVLLAKRPAIGITAFLLGSLLFGVLAYNLGTNGKLIKWDMTAAKAFNNIAPNMPANLVEYFVFGFFVGKEIVITIGAILSLYFLYKQFWRELAMVLIGLGGGGLIWYFLSHYFERALPAGTIDIPLIQLAFFPNGQTFAAILCYGLLAYLLVPQMPSRFWKWIIVIMLALVAALAGVSPLLLGTDYASDVIAGYALGIAWAGLAYTLTEKFFEEGRGRNRDNSLKKAKTEPLRAPGWFKKWPILGVVLILLGSVSLGALGFNLLSHGPLLQVDQFVYKSLLAQAKAAPPATNEIMLFGFFIGKQVVQVIVTILTVYFLYHRFWRELGMLWISSAGGSVVWNFIIGFFDRPRPPEQTGLIIKTIPSFPSGHAMSALICYGLLAYLLIPKMPSRFWKWTLAIVALLFILFDGFSRVFQGNHYLTDVLAGYALGIAWAGLVYTLIENIFIRRKKV